MQLSPIPVEKFDQGVRLKQRNNGKWYLFTPPKPGEVEEGRLAVTVYLGLPPSAPVTQEQARDAARRMAGERDRGITITSSQIKITVAEVIALYKAELERVEHESLKTITCNLKWLNARIGGPARGAAHDADAAPHRGPVAEEADEDLAPDGRAPGLVHHQVPVRVAALGAPPRRDARRDPDASDPALAEVPAPREAAELSRARGVLRARRGRGRRRARPVRHPGVPAAEPGARVRGGDRVGLRVRVAQPGGALSRVGVGGRRRDPAAGLDLQESEGAQGAADRGAGGGDRPAAARPGLRGQAGRGAAVQVRLPLPGEAPAGQVR